MSDKECDCRLSQICNGREGCKFEAQNRKVGAKGNLKVFTTKADERIAELKKEVDSLRASNEQLASGYSSLVNICINNIDGDGDSSWIPINKEVGEALYETPSESLSSIKAEWIEDITHKVRPHSMADDRFCNFGGSDKAFYGYLTALNVIKDFVKSDTDRGDDDVEI